MEDNTNHGTKQLSREIHKKNLEVQKQQVHQKQDKDENKKWATFTHYSPKIRKTNQPLQTYQHKQCIQKYKNNTAIYKTKDAR
jgi:hypothetical protein